jgi:hypothetical protein
MVESNKTCICTLAIEVSDNNYIERVKILIESYLKYTNFDILILTNRINELSYLNDKRIKLIDYDKNFDEKNNFWSTYSDKFASFCRIHHWDGRVVDYMGTDTGQKWSPHAM